MLRRWASIVRGLSTSCSAISRFVRPAATSSAICCSRAVSGPRAGLARGAQHAVAEAAQLAHRLVAAADRAEAVERGLGGRERLDGGAPVAGRGQRPPFGEPCAGRGERGARRAPRGRRGRRLRARPARAAPPSGRRRRPRSGRGSGAPRWAPPAAARAAVGAPRAAAADIAGARAAPRPGRRPLPARSAGRTRHRPPSAVPQRRGAGSALPAASERRTEAPARLAGGVHVGGSCRAAPPPRPRAARPATSPAASRAVESALWAHRSMRGLPARRAQLEPLLGGGDRLADAAELDQRRHGLDRQHEQDALAAGALGDRAPRSRSSSAASKRPSARCARPCIQNAGRRVASCGSVRRPSAALDSSRRSAASAPTRAPPPARRRRAPRPRTPDRRVPARRRARRSTGRARRRGRRRAAPSGRAPGAAARGRPTARPAGRAARRAAGAAPPRGSPSHHSWLVSATVSARRSSAPAACERGEQRVARAARVAAGGLRVGQPRRSRAASRRAEPSGSSRSAAA